MEAWAVYSSIMVGCDVNVLGFMRVLGAQGRDHEEPAPCAVAHLPSDPIPLVPGLGLTSARTKLIPMHNWHVFPWWHPSAPPLPFLCSQTRSSPNWLFFPIVFKENHPTLYHLSPWPHEFVSPLLRQLMASMALGEPKPSSAGVWSHHTCDSWLVLKPSQPHICLSHGHITYVSCGIHYRGY